MMSYYHKNVIYLPQKTKQTEYVSLNANQLRTLSLIDDELTYQAAIELLKKRFFDIDIHKLSDLLKANIFNIKRVLMTLSKLSFISFEGNRIKINQN